MTRWLLTVTITTLLLTLVVGCGDDDGDGDATATTAGSDAPTFTTAQLETFGRDFVAAVSEGDRDALASVLRGVVSDERIDELAACKPDDMDVNYDNVAVVVEPPTVRLTGTVDVTQAGTTSTRTVDWVTEVSEVSDGVYLLSAPPSGCPAFLQSP